MVGVRFSTRWRGSTPRADGSVIGIEGRDNVRRRNRLVTAAALLASIVVALVATTGAMAATSNEIYKDYADNGKIDGNYTKSELQRALQDVSIQGYTKPGPKKRIKPAIQKSLDAKGTLAQTGKKTGGLPFTGFDLGLMALGGAALLAVGASFRRLGKVKQTP